MLAFGLLLAIVSPAQSLDESASERLKSLIESTDQLEHFHAEFTIDSGPDKEEGRVWLDYRAPDSIRLRVESPGESMSMGCGGDILWVRSQSEGETATEGRVDFLDRSGPCAEAAALLREDFWNRPEGSDVYLRFDWRLDTERDKLDFSVSVFKAITSASAGSGRLGWLTTMRTLEGELTLEDSELVHRSPRAEARVDALTGFLKRLVLTSAEGEQIQYELSTLDLETAPPIETFAIPDPDPAANDISEAMQQGLMSRQGLRKLALNHVDRMLRDGDRRFDSEVHDALERFLRALHEPVISERWSEWLEQSRKWSAEYGEWLRSELQSGTSKDDLESAAHEKRAVMAAQLERARSTLREGLPADSFDGDHGRVMRELEIEVIDSRFDALIAQPMLDDFDAHVDDALD